MSFDCIIVGGSNAGLSASLALGRTRHKVLVLDGGEPCNRFSAHSHNFLGHDGQMIKEMASHARNQILENYEDYVQFESATVTKLSKNNETGLFEVFAEHTDASNQTWTAKKLILATGVTDIMSVDVPGWADCWGISIVHCPFCHGFEFRDQPTVLVSSGPVAEKLVPLLLKLSPTSVKLLTNGNEHGLPEEVVTAFEKKGVELINTPIAQVIHKEGSVSALVLEDQSTIEAKVVYSHFPFKNNLVENDFGLELKEDGYIPVDSFQKTPVKGVFACGDGTTMLRTVATAVGAGNLAGIMASFELALEAVY